MPVDTDWLSKRIANSNARLEAQYGKDWYKCTCTCHLLDETNVFCCSCTCAINEEHRLKIAIPRAETDPVLLYCLPYCNGYAYIELTRWE